MAAGPSLCVRLRNTVPVLLCSDRLSQCGSWSSVVRPSEWHARHSPYIVSGTVITRAVEALARKCGDWVLPHWEHNCAQCTENARLILFSRMKFELKGRRFDTGMQHKSKTRWERCIVAQSDPFDDQSGGRIQIDGLSVRHTYNTAIAYWWPIWWSDIAYWFDKG